MGRDFYDVLGVPRDADQGTIRRAYRVRSRVLHPDVSPDGDVAAFSELADAYAVLSKPEARRLYDGLGWRARPRASDGADVVATIEVDAYEASVGTTRQIPPWEGRRLVEVPVPRGSGTSTAFPWGPNRWRS